VFLSILFCIIFDFLILNLKDIDSSSSSVTYISSEVNLISKYLIIKPLYVGFSAISSGLLLLRFLITNLAFFKLLFVTKVTLVISELSALFRINTFSIPLAISSHSADCSELSFVSPNKSIDPSASPVPSLFGIGSSISVPSSAGLSDVGPASGSSSVSYSIR